MLDNSRLLGQLVPADCRNLLSKDAQIRIDDALHRALAIRAEALAKVQAMTGAKNKAALLWSDAQIKAATILLKAYVVELMAIGKRGAELVDLMAQETEHACYSWELTGTERRAVEARLRAVRPAAQPKTISETNPKKTTTTKKGRRVEMLDVDLRRIKDVCGDTSQQAFAMMGKMSLDTLQRAMAGKATEKTLNKICLAAKIKGLKISPKNLKINLPQ